MCSMSSAMMDLFNRYIPTSCVEEAKAFISSSSNIVRSRVIEVTLPYKELAAQATEVMTEKFVVIKSANSLLEVAEILLGIVMAIVGFLSVQLKRFQASAKDLYESRSSEVRDAVNNVTDSVKVGIMNLPSSPLAEKVDLIGKKVLGDERQKQVVDFIKTNVVSKVIPTDSPTASVTTAPPDEVSSNASPVSNPRSHHRKKKNNKD
jgi:hypothetical protein